MTPLAPRIEVAIDWLATYLAPDPVTEREFRENAPLHLSAHAMNCAKKRLGVVTFRRNFRNWLALPTDPSIPPQRKNTHDSNR